MTRVGASVESALSQTLAPHEVVVVVDGSTDGMADALRGAGPSVRVERQANAGVSVARKRCVACAVGDWIALLDADDIWLPDKLQRQIALLRAQPDARPACGGWHAWYSSDPEPPATLKAELAAVADDPRRWGGPSSWIYGELLKSCCVWLSRVVVHRDLLVRTGGFEVGLSVGEDLDLWLRASRLTPIVSVPGPLATYRQHAANTTRRVPAVNNQAMVVERAIARWGLIGPACTATPQREICAALTQTCRDFTGSNLQAGRWQPTREVSRRALQLDRFNPAGWWMFPQALLEDAPPGRATPR